MKGVGKILVTFAIVTGALLLYVHEQVEVLRVSYRIYDKSSALNQRSEELRQLQFDVDRLHSPQNLEKRLEELSLGLTLPKEIQVLRVPELKVSPEIKHLPINSLSNRFLNFLGQWIQTAQARTEQ